MRPALVHMRACMCAHRGPWDGTISIAALQVQAPSDRPILPQIWGGEGEEGDTPGFLSGPGTRSPPKRLAASRMGLICRGSPPSFPITAFDLARLNRGSKVGLAAQA